MPLSDEELLAAFETRFLAIHTDEDRAEVVAGLRAVESAVRADMALRAVSTVEELDALPVGSVLSVTDEGVPCAAIKCSTDGGRGEDRWWVTGFEADDGYAAWYVLALYADSGITVLWVPVTPGGESRG